MKERDINDENVTKNITTETTNKHVKKKKGIINIKFAYPIKNSNNDVTFSFSVTLDTRMCVSAHML